MSRNVYRLCNTSHVQSKPAKAKIIQTIVYWLGHLFAKPRLTMVCITPVQPQLQQSFNSIKAAATSTENTAEQARAQAISQSIAQSIAQAQDPTDKCPNNNTTKQPLSSSDSTLTKAGKKANMLFLKVYNGPIFQDKKVDPTVKTPAQPSTQTDQSSQSSQLAQLGLSVQDLLCPPNHGLYPACLQMLNPPKQGKKSVFISGKMSDIFAQLDQLAA